MTTVPAEMHLRLLAAERARGRREGLETALRLIDAVPPGLDVRTREGGDVSGEELRELVADLVDGIARNEISNPTDAIMAAVRLHVDLSTVIGYQVRIFGKWYMVHPSDVQIVCADDEPPPDRPTSSSPERTT